MEDYYFEAHIEAEAEQIDPLCALLTEMGSTGVTVEEKALDTFVPPATDTPDVAGTIKAYFGAQWEEAGLQHQLDALGQQMHVRAPIRVVRKETRDWAQEWKQHFPPLQVGSNLLILPSWEPVPEPAPPHMLRLDPGMAFGTGTHETTALCLEQMAAAIETGQLKSVLDVGTGSGILAMAAAALGVTEVLGCDIDAEACRVARENCDVNGLQRVEVTDAPLEELPAGYDLVVANILAEENVRLAAELCRRVVPGGWLILSGILTEKESLVIQGFRDYDLQGPRIVRRDAWSCLTYRKGTA